MSGIAGQRAGFGTIHGFDRFAPDQLVEEVRHTEALGW
jgi:hypothetical protein